MRLIDADKLAETIDHIRLDPENILGFYRDVLNAISKQPTAYDLDKETWKYIDGYEETYQISNSGEVRNKHKEILAQATNNKGYKTVCLSRNGNAHQLLVHRLVAKYFVPNPMLKSQVNHIDEDKTNNHYTNLEWVTPKENINHGDAIRKSAETRGVRVAKLNDDMDIVEVYPTISEASRQTGVPQQNISRCLSGGTKKAGGWHWMREEAIDIVKRGGVNDCI